MSDSPRPAALSRLLTDVVNQATSIPTATVQRHVDSLRRRNPQATPGEILNLLSREYLTLVGGAGAAVGIAAAIPGIGTGAGLTLSAGDVGTFFAASAAYGLAVADVHGITTDDAERRRALLLSTVLGPSGAQVVSSALEGSSVLRGRALLSTLPRNTIKQVNSVLSHRLVKRHLLKQSGLAIGRVIPFGIGAFIGFTGGRALGRTVLRQAQTAFGEPPSEFQRALRRQSDTIDPGGSQPGPRRIIQGQVSD